MPEHTAAVPGDGEPSPGLNADNKSLENSAYLDLSKKGHSTDILLEIAGQSHRSATALNKGILSKGWQETSPRSVGDEQGISARSLGL